MSEKKLKPEHRKLWRRIYLDSFEGDGTSPEDAERMADKVVEQWEARGAFDEESPSTPNTFTPPLALVLTQDPGVTYRQINSNNLQFDLAVAFARPSDGDGSVLIALSERGAKLCRIAFEQSFALMLACAQEIR